MSKRVSIQYQTGQLHAVRIDANTVAVIMPEDYACLIRDISMSIGGDPTRSRRKYVDMLCTAINGLKGIPDENLTDFEKNTKIMKKTNDSVLV